MCNWLQDPSVRNYTFQCAVRSKSTVFTVLYEVGYFLISGFFALRRHPYTIRPSVRVLATSTGIKYRTVRVLVMQYRNSHAHHCITYPVLGTSTRTRIPMPGVRVR